MTLLPCRSVVLRLMPVVQAFAYNAMLAHVKAALDAGRKPEGLLVATQTVNMDKDALPWMRRVLR